MNLLEPARIPSRRLELVPVTAAHAQAMFPLLAREELYRQIGGGPPESMADLEQWFRLLETRRSPDGEECWLTWILFTEGGRDAVGYVQATIHGGNADLAWLVGVPWQGRGYAREAASALVNWLRAHGIGKISAQIKPGYGASEKIAESAGLRPSGQFHEGEEIWRS